MSRAARQGTQWAELRGARHALHADWTKTRTAGGTTWLVAGTVTADGLARAATELGAVAA